MLLSLEERDPCFWLGEITASRGGIGLDPRPLALVGTE